eukprot:1838990-Rhodomonas_salina.3
MHTLPGLPPTAASTKPAPIHPVRSRDPGNARGKDVRVHRGSLSCYVARLPLPVNITRGHGCVQPSEAESDAGRRDPCEPEVTFGCTHQAQCRTEPNFDLKTA